jgi:hypothetical protein
MKMQLRSLLVVAAMGLFAIVPAEAKKMKTPKSANANVKQATHKAKKYKAGKYKAQKLSKKPSKSARVKYGTKQKSVTRN